MAPIIVRRSTGEFLAPNGSTLFGSGRAADAVAVRSQLPVAVRFYDDNGNRTLLNAATNILTFTARPAPGDAFTVGPTTYSARGIDRQTEHLLSQGFDRLFVQSVLLDQLEDQFPLLVRAHPVVAGRIVERIVAVLSFGSG